MSAAVPAVDRAMFVQIARTRREVAGYEQASAAYLAAQAAARFDRADDLPPVLITDADGTVRGHISFNGRVWAGAPADWSERTALLYDSKAPGGTLDRAAAALP